MSLNEFYLRRSDIHIQIVIDSNCNLACDYCFLLNKNLKYDKNKSISYEVLDAYIDFFQKYYNDILKYYKKIIITFFGGEPLLSEKKIIYFMKKLSNYDNIFFKIHTNGLLISKFLLTKLLFINKTRYSFHISIDGRRETMLKYRLKLDKQFIKIIKNIKILKKNKIIYYFSATILNPNAKQLFKDFKYLYSLGPRMININPVTGYYPKGLTRFEIKEILKGFKILFDYLINKDLSYKELICLFDLPKNIKHFRYLFKFGINIYFDIDGKFYPIILAIKGFDDGTTFEEHEKKVINIGDIKHPEKFIKIIKDIHLNKKLKNLSLNQQRKWIINDWSIQNILSVFILKYFKTFYLENEI